MSLLKRILAALKQRGQPRSPTVVVAAQSSQVELNKPHPESTVIAFETQHHIRLPEDYRDFLIHTGDGGAGVFRLGEMDDGFDFKRWKENDGFVGVLSEPSPHTAPWNDLTGMPAELDDSLLGNLAIEDAYWELRTKWEENHYWNTRHVNGAIPIFHLGCARRQWLVITGPEAGYVWDGLRVDLKGLRPCTLPGKPHLTFLEWYTTWLDKAMQA